MCQKRSLYPSWIFHKLKRSSTVRRTTQGSNKNNLAKSSEINGFIFGKKEKMISLMNVAYHTEETDGHGQQNIMCIFQMYEIFSQEVIFLYKVIEMNFTLITDHIKHLNGALNSAFKSHSA